MRRLYFVELPADEHGNRAYTGSFPCVVEADVEELGGGVQRLHIKAPVEIASKWSTIVNYGGWVECEGPARSLTRGERDRLIRGK